MNRNEFEIIRNIEKLRSLAKTSEFLEWQSKRICKNCKWIEKTGEYLNCLNKNNNDPFNGCYMGIPDEDFGCNQWEKQD